jgi:hypothetical protein
MKTRTYLNINSKEMVLTQRTLSYDNFGKIEHRFVEDIIPYGECKKYVNSLTHFICKTAEYIKENGDLFDITENKTLKQIEEAFDRAMDWIR